MISRSIRMATIKRARAHTYTHTHTLDCHYINHVNYSFCQNFATRETEHTGASERMRQLLINGNIRWEYTFSWQANRAFLTHGFVVLFWCTEWIWNKHCNTNYSYKLVATFKVVPEVVYGSLATMEKQANPIGMTWPAYLCHLAPILLYNILSAHRFPRTGNFNFLVIS